MKTDGFTEHVIITTDTYDDLKEAKRKTKEANEALKQKQKATIDELTKKANQILANHIEAYSLFMEFFINDYKRFERFDEEEEQLFIRGSEVIDAFNMENGRHKIEVTADKKIRINA